MYDDNAPKLIANGYHPLPISPLGFEPKKAPVRFVPEFGKFVLYKCWSSDHAPVSSPQPGAGIGIRCGDNGIIGLDFDDDDAALIISDALPEPLVCKVGERGWTAFYQADFDVASENFYDACGRLVMQVLGRGRQTVIPPSIHPDTKKPYHWTNGRSLFDTLPSEHTLLPRDYRELILKLGYKTERGTEPRQESAETYDPETIFDAESEFAEVNGVALRNLSAWVPALNLYKCKRRGGRGASYDAVAIWRESHSGRPLEQRSANLRIHPKGIVDFGDGNKGYSAVDLVMAARNCSNHEALGWPQEKLLPPKPDIEIDLDRITETQDAPSTPEEEAKPAQQDERLKILGHVWRDGDPVKRPQVMSIPHLLPDVPFHGLFLGQRSTYKSFVLNSLAVALAAPMGKFAGQQVRRRGFVIQIEFEGSSSDVRIIAAKRDAGVLEALPIQVFTELPPTVIVNKKENPAWGKYAAALASWAKDEAARWGLPLVLITFDPMNKFAGFSREDDSAEGNVFGRAMDKLARLASCPIVIADHLGKDASRGARGTSTKEQNAYFVWDVGERPKTLGESREFVITKMKNGPDGVGVKFHMEKAEEVEFLQEGEINPRETVMGTATTLVVRWEGEDFLPTGEIGGGSDLTDNEQIALKHLAKMCLTDPRPIPQGRHIAGVLGTSLAAWQYRVTRAIWGNVRHKSEIDMLKLQRGLQRKERIDTDGEVIWSI